MNNYWAGVISGCCAASILFTCLMFSIIGQNQALRKEVAQLREEVADHEEVIRQYEFYVWHNMKFFGKRRANERTNRTDTDLHFVSNPLYFVEIEICTA